MSLTKMLELLDRLGSVELTGIMGNCKIEEIIFNDNMVIL
jgi:hypothetical protein